MRADENESVMTMKTLFQKRLSLAFALFLAPAAIFAAPAANWTLNFIQSAEGGHSIGNPVAPTKVVEYASYTCDHCARFEREDVPILKRDYIAKGKVALEVRNLVRDPVDLTVALLARCGGKGRFFGNHRHFMVTQSQWMANAAKISAANEAKLERGDASGFALGAYTDMGLSAFAKQRGITDSQAKICLADKVALKKVLDMTDKAVGPLGLQGTPSFLINGKVVADIHDLADMKRYLPN
jgi:protein-disulfide isomerase